MSKGNKKGYDRIRAITIKWVAENYDVTREYVRASVLGTATTGRSQELKKAFNEKYTELEKILS